MSLAREALVQSIASTRSAAVNLTRVLAVDESKALLEARAAVLVLVTELSAALREFDEERDPEKTPVRFISEDSKKAHESSSKFSAAEVRRLLDEGREVSKK